MNYVTNVSKLIGIALDIDVDIANLTFFSGIVPSACPGGGSAPMDGDRVRLSRFGSCFHECGYLSGPLGLPLARIALAKKRGLAREQRWRDKLQVSAIHMPH